MGWWWVVWSCLFSSKDTCYSLTKLIRYLCGLGFLWMLSSPCPSTPVPLRFERVHPPMSSSFPYRGLTLDNLVYGTASLPQSRWSSRMASLQFGEHLFLRQLTSRAEYFVKATLRLFEMAGCLMHTFVIFWRVLQFLSITSRGFFFNCTLMVQGNYCKGHTFINWNRKYFVGVLIKWGDLRFKWHIESF